MVIIYTCIPILSQQQFFTQHSGQRHLLLGFREMWLEKKNPLLQWIKLLHTWLLL